MKTNLQLSILLISAAMLLSQAAVAVNVTDGLIHLWHLDETSGSTAADSIGDWDLQVVGGATLGVPGFDGTGVLLDGGTNDRLESAPVVDDFLASDFTLSLWLYWVSLEGKPGILEFASNTGLRDLGLDLSYSDLKPRVDAHIGPGFFGWGSSKSINDGQWHLLSLVRRGNSAFLYLDDVQVGTGSGAFQQNGASAIFRLGEYGGTHQFGGIIDEVAIYNRALSPSEVAANAVPEPRTVALLGLVAGVLAFPRRHNPRR